MFSFRRHRQLLRTALLVLLVLGMVIQPVLGALGDLHKLEHAVSAQFDHAHGHGDDHAHDHDVVAHHDQGGDGSGDDESGRDGSGGDRPAPDHASGSHGLLHQGGAVTATLPEAMTSLLRQVPSEPRLPEFGPFHLPGDTPNLPFRPPIA